MSYSRGDYYIWSDGKRLHIWTHRDHEYDTADMADVFPGRVNLPENLADAFAVMRFAELLEMGIVDSILDHVAASPAGHNLGGDALRKHAPAIKERLQPLIEEQRRLRLQSRQEG